MPWEDILENLHQNCSDRNLSEIPHPQECLKYMLRVHMQVAGQDLHLLLRQVMARPFVLLHLLDYLIDHNHEVFRGKGSAEKLKRQMREAVEREYPEREAHIEECARTGSIPPSILQLLEEAQLERDQAEEHCQRNGLKRKRVLDDKNSTPGDGATSVENCLNDLRPHAMCVDKSVQACSDPATLREGALERYGDLNVKTGGKEILQFHSKYFSQILPFVIPYMVSGPDFFPDKRWRRSSHENAPWVSPQMFAASFAQRVEAQCRVDWAALPIVRSVAFKWMAEHTMSTLSAFGGRLGNASDTSSAAMIKAAQNLYHTLHNGFIGSGVHRVPVAGDTNRLPFASGLTSLEKKLAWSAKFLASNMQVV